MPDDIEDFRRFMELPETNKQVVAALLDECMAPADYVGEMKVQKILWSETDERS